MRKRTRPPHAALSIAGFDPSGGAGVLADVRGFERAGVWGAAVVTVLTVQSTRGLRRAIPVSSQIVREQANEILAATSISAIKIGAVGSKENADVLRQVLRRVNVPIVFDPVIRASKYRARTTRLDGGATRESILALARTVTLLTPNADEAAFLLQRKVETTAQAEDAARALVDLGIPSVLVKGGHVQDATRCIDYFATANAVIAIDRPRQLTQDVHGTGCALSSLIAGWLACRHATGAPNELRSAILWAKKELSRALQSPLVVGIGMPVLNVSRRLPSLPKRSLNLRNA